MLQPPSEPTPMPGSAPIDAATTEANPATSGSSPSATGSPEAPIAGGPSRRRRLLRRMGVVAGIGFVLVFVFGAGVGLERSGLVPGRDVPSAPAAAEDFGLVREAWDLIHTEYVGASELDSRDLAYAAIEAFAEKTGDTGHTRFMTPEEREAARQDLSGEFVGIGVQVDLDGEDIRIVDVFADSPAERAGLLRGDVILSVDGEATTGQAIDEVVQRVRGPEGTDVRLSIGRTDAAEPLDVTITRARIERPAVSWTMVPGTSIADIHLDQFQTGAADEFKVALEGVAAAGASGAVIDLRGNPGGYVDEARAITSQFLREGVVYQTRDARGQVDPNDVVEGGIAFDLPIVVLVDGGTASSSEITAGALQDAGRATVVGAKTFGTGTVLGEFVLGDGSALRIGTVEWLTPDGRRIWHEGITPDVTVDLADDAFPLSPAEVAELTADELAASDDTQLLRAIELVKASAER